MRLMSTAVATVMATLVLSVCMFMTAPSLSESGPEAEPNGLKPIVRFVDQREGVVYTDRPERRYPLHAQSRADAHELAVQDADALNNRRPPQRADIDESLADQVDFARQAERKAQFTDSGVVILAAQCVGRLRIAGADAADCPAGERIAADIEAIAEPQRGVVERGDVADRAADRGDEVVDDLLIERRIGGGAKIVVVADQAGHGEGVPHQESLRRIEALIARVPSQGLGDFRRQRLACLRLHGERRV